MTKWFEKFILWDHYKKLIRPFLFKKFWLKSNFKFFQIKEENLILKMKKKQKVTPFEMKNFTSNGLSFKKSFNI